MTSTPLLRSMAMLLVLAAGCTHTVKVEPIKESRVSLIKIEDSEPNRAALLANEVAQAYSDEVMAQKLKLTENASRWLDERRDSLSDSARSSELALYEYRKQSDILALDDRASMVSTRLQETGKVLTEAQIRIAGLKARAAAIRSVQSQQGADDRLWAEALPAGVGNDEIEQRGRARGRPAGPASRLPATRVASTKATRRQGPRLPEAQGAARTARGRRVL